MLPALLAISSSLAASIVAKVTVITALALFAVWLARGSRAAVRHALLAAAFGVVLLFPLASVVVPTVHFGVPVAVENRPAAAAPVLSGVEQIPPVLLADGPDVPAISAPQSSRISLSNLLLAGWIAGGAIFLLPLVIGLWQIRLLRRSGLPWRRGQSLAETIALDAGVRRRVQVLLHEGVPGPMTCGILHPAIVLPQDAENWNEEDLNRAFVHELEHVRRSDSLSHCLARAVCAIYWFHPLVWIAWRRLALEAERSCDDAVLRRSEATAYADQLVGLAKRLSVAQRSPVLAMANRADLATRVRAVLDARQRRGRAGTLSLGLATTAAVVLAISMSSLILVATPQAAPTQPAPAKPADPKAQVEPSHEKSDPPSPVAQALTPAQPASTAQEKLEFEVASVRPYSPTSRTDDPVAQILAAPRMSGGPGTPDPERLTIERMPLRMLLFNAYGVRPDQISAPDWLDSEAFDISAKIPPGTTKEQANTMLQNLLIERFNITLHHTTKDLPGYELTVAKNGSKLKEVTPDPAAIAPKFGQFPSLRLDSDANGFPIMPEGRIGILAVRGGDGLNRMTCRACSLAELIDRIKTDLAVPSGMARFFIAGRIVDKTGLTEKYDFHLEYLGGLVGAALQPPSVDDQTVSGPDLFSALDKQLGLKLEKTKVPLDVLVIDHADKTPTDN